MERNKKAPFEYKVVIPTLPEKPGVYQYFNTEDEIIYVGKAKNLKKRVSSYFTKQHENKKVAALVKQIADLKYIVVDSEEDALLLENNLIKQYNPRYNILLKDDKTYPWLCITNEPFPRIFKTRKIINDGSKYFGPFSSVNTLSVLLNTLREIYPIRTCKLRLTEENISRKTFKVCLQYHIHKCLGPCVGYQKEDEYSQMINEIEQIVKGNTGTVIKYMEHEMKELSDQLQFEAAQKIKVKYEVLENYKAKSIVTTITDHEFDVFSFEEDETTALVNVLHITNGAIVQGVTVTYTKKLDEPKEEILALAIIELRERLKSDAKEIIVQFQPDLHQSDLTITIPQKGDKKKLLELSLQNTHAYKLEKLKQTERLNPEQRVTRILSTLQKDLNMKELPIHIECFDNSNIQGTNPVAACVVFKKARPSKQEYRHFVIKTVEGPNDYASMEEVVYRRYHRLSEEASPLPQLIIIDGGKGQLKMALTAMEKLHLENKITIIGIAKRLEEIYFTNDPIPLYLDKNSESLKLIQQIRDEAHRFGITHHRLKRSKTQVTSELDTIPGIGEKSKQALITHFRSVKRLKSATKEEISEIIGNNKASIIYTYFHPNLRL